MWRELAAGEPNLMLLMDFYGQFSDHIVHMMIQQQSHCRFHSPDPLLRDACLLNLLLQTLLFDKPFAFPLVSSTRFSLITIFYPKIMKRCIVVGSILPRTAVDALAEDYTTAIQQVVTKLDEHAATQREQGRDIRELGRDLRDHVREQSRDAREMKARLATVDTRLNRMDERLDTLSEDVGSLKVEMNQKFEQVITLLTQSN
jgi:hypothetical protein